MTSISEHSISIDGTVFANRRAESRFRVFKGATLTFNRGYGALECVVRNRSEHGARLSFGDASAVPPQFDLRIAGEGAAHRARVCWRTMTQVGVSLDR